MSFDELEVWTGRLDRFDWKIVGKQEIYIPYNSNRFLQPKKDTEVLIPGQHHVASDKVRWELHRVWVVEATLKPGKRHIYHKRTFYIDEDSWVAVMSDEYDARGQLYRGVMAPTAFAYDQKAMGINLQIGYDLIAGLWSSQGNCGLYYGIKYRDAFPSRDWQPDALAGAGIR